MTTTIKPIETAAFGRRFRSRLEARYAVFLTTLGLRWEYEPEGFQLPSGWYLPDFKVYHSNGGHGYCWMEVKPTVDGHHLPDDQCPREVLLARELARATRAVVVFGAGGAFDVMRNAYLRIVTDRSWFRKEYPSYEKEGGSFTKTECLPIQYWKPPSQIDRDLWKEFPEEDPDVTGRDLPRDGNIMRWTSYRLDFLGEAPTAADLHKAATAALSARFEHGEAHL